VSVPQDDSPITVAESYNVKRTLMWEASQLRWALSQSTWSADARRALELQLEELQGRLLEHACVLRVASERARAAMKVRLLGCLSHGWDLYDGGGGGSSGGVVAVVVCVGGGCMCVCW
jgi:hypothetical protein